MAVVYWITGLSGAGKTTLATELTKALRAKSECVAHLDGDVLRAVFDLTQSAYSRDERLALALRYARLCQELARQEITVVCSTISFFDAVRDWNRANIPDYCEIYLRVPLEIRKARDYKGVYRDEGDASWLEPPKAPDLLFDNVGDVRPADMVAQILSRRSTSRRAHP